MCNFYDYMKKQIRSSNPVLETALRSQRHDSNTELAGKYEWIENEPDTADESSPIGGSWKAYWMHNGVVGGEKVNEWPTACSVANCTRKAEHGAHVRDADGVVSIVPMCAKDNNPHNKKDMRLKKDTIMVKVGDKSVKLTTDDAISAIKKRIEECKATGGMFTMPEIEGCTVEECDEDTSGSTVWHSKYILRFPDGRSIHADYQSKDRSGAFNNVKGRSCITVECSDHSNDFSDSWEERV